MGCNSLITQENIALDDVLTHNFAMKTHTELIKVRFGETDAAGVVYHANYFPYLEDARTRMLDSMGIPYKTLVGMGYHLPIVEAHIRYRASAFFDDLLEVTAKALPMEGSRVIIEYTIKRDGLLLTEAKTTLAFVNTKGFPVKPPKEFVEKFNAAIKK